MTNNYLPKITVLTPSFNQGGYIRKNILSVCNQHYPNFEHIIIDGGSTDETVSILESYSHIRWVSEKDAGQADALNKGLCMATGDIIGWLNSDDYYVDDIFGTVADYFSKQQLKWIVGNTKTYFEIAGHTVDNHVATVSFNNLLNNPDIVRQQGAFYRRTAIEEVGGWDASLFMVMDYDLWVKLSKLSLPLMANKTFGCSRITGNQKTSLQNARCQLLEIDRVLKRNGASFINRIHVRLKKELSVYIWRLKASQLKLS